MHKQQDYAQSSRAIEDVVAAVELCVERRLESRQQKVELKDVRDVEVAAKPGYHAGQEVEEYQTSR